MELRRLRYFVAVAEELHFGRAAEKLHLAQPPLSQQIKKLEQEVGVPLLIRSKRKVELTRAGHALLREARAILDQARRGIDTAVRASRGEVGEFSLGFVPHADIEILPSVLPEFRRRFPDIQIKVHCLSNLGQVEALALKKIDVGIAFLPVDDPRCVTEVVRSEPFVAVLPRWHRLANQPAISLPELADDTFIFFRRELAPAFFDSLVSEFRSSGFSPKSVQEVDHVQTRVGLVASGLGITVLPQCVIKLARPELVFRPLKSDISEARTALIYRRDDDNPIRSVFSEVMHSSLKPTGPHYWNPARPDGKLSGKRQTALKASSSKKSSS